MSEDFEARLRALFAAGEEAPTGERFGSEIRRRIAVLRNTRRVAVVGAATASAVAVVIFGAPLLAAGSAVIAGAPSALNDALSVLLASPVGYALGGLTATAAVVEAFRD
jgi:hypothetical protein